MFEALSIERNIKRVGGEKDEKLLLSSSSSTNFLQHQQARPRAGWMGDGKSKRIHYPTFGIERNMLNNNYIVGNI